MIGVAAVVIFYNPDFSVLDNLKTYAFQVDKIFVVDNSDTINVRLINKIKLMTNVEYFCNYSNLGIAAALNIGAREAINEGFKYLLTMDQDSKCVSDMVENLLRVMKSSSQVGIVAPEYIHPNGGKKINKSKFNINSKEILYTITSCNLLSLIAFQNIGGFLEKLFIDHVDHEYCLRLNKNGYKVIITNTTYAFHKIGNTEIKNFFGFSLSPSFHPSLRLYYRTRNRLFVDRIYKNTYPEYVKEDRRHFFREMVEVILFEKDLLNKIKMVLKGYIHFKKNIMGKYPENLLR